MPRVRLARAAASALRVRKAAAACPSCAAAGSHVAARDALASVIAPHVWPGCGTFYSLQGKKPRKDLDTPAQLTLHGDVLFVGDAHCRIMAFDTGDLVPKYEIGRAGSADGQFGGPVGGMVAYGGELFVCDTANHRIQVFSLEQRGKFVRTIGTRGTEPGRFESPCAVAAAGDVLLVADAAVCSQQSLNKGGKGSGRTCRLQAILITSGRAIETMSINGSISHLFACQTGTPQLLAADADNSVVHVFKLKGVAAQRGRAARHGGPRALIGEVLEKQNEALSPLRGIGGRSHKKNKS